MGSKHFPGGNGSRPPTVSGLDVGATATPDRRQRQETGASADDFRRMPTPRRPEPTLAVQKIETLLKLNTVLREEINLLATALAKADRRAYYDELTGLPNSRLFQDHFQLARRWADRHHSQVGVICIDLGAIGVAVADSAAVRLLQQAAGRLVSNIRRYDTACRYGDGGFIVLLPHLDDPGHVVAVQGRISARLSMPYDADGEPIDLEASSGVATYPFDGENYAAVLKAANYAMHHRKATTAVAASACRFVLRE
jgi:diguanylate cyclase (GGDEF)-like protein